MKLFKNFKTKKQLKGEIKALEHLLNASPTIYREERNVQKIKAVFKSDTGDYPCPSHIIKREIAKELAEKLVNVIEYDFSDDEYGNRIYTGTISVAVKGSLSL